MRKFILLFSMLAFAGLSYAQLKVNGVPTPVKEGPVQNTIITAPEKGGGDVFWSTTFDWGTGEDTTSWSLPEGWTIVDNTDFGMPWMWRSPYDTVGGNWTNQGPSPGFETPMDGYIVVPANEYNYRDEVSTDNVVDTYIMTSSIDCSDKSSVVVNFNQLFRTCCARGPSMKMMVTNDDGVHWAEYDCRFGLSNNRVTDFRYRTVEFNISDVAAGMSNVKIKFYWTGSFAYYWMIDDLKLTEAYENEVVLEDFWAEINMNFDERVGHINYLPKSQLGIESESALGGNIGDYEFSGAMLNNGMADQWNLQLQMTILKNGEQIFEETSDPLELWSLERDTLTVNNVFLADDYGDYSMTFAAISENDEEVPENDTKEIMFTVTDSLYHRADFSDESGANTGGWIGGSNAGDMVGVWYDLFTNSEISAITAKIRNVSDDELPEFQFVLLRDMGDDGLVEWLVTDIYPADSTMERTWVTHNIEKDGETEFLEPGQYVAAVRFWGDNGTEEGSNGMSIGWDMDNREGGYTYMYQFVSENTYTTGKVNQIGIVFNEHGGPGESSVTFNVDMNAHIANGEFNPGSDFVDVAGTFNEWTGSDALADDDGDGIYSITIDAIPVAEKLEYKYRINANWDTSEFPDGGPNRTYIVRYWNELDDIYNDGVTTGIKNIQNLEAFKVYPNPTRGQFTVELTSSQSSDITLKLINLQGRVVYTKVLSGVISHKETIDENLVRGLYFLTIESGSGVKTQKVIVK